MNLDQYFKAQHSAEYDCLAFTCDVWFSLTGEDLCARLNNQLGACLRGFERLDIPTSPCLVLMRGPKVEPHVGVYDQGTVLHLQAGGARRVVIDILKLMYRHVEFYR